MRVTGLSPDRSSLEYPADTKHDPMYTRQEVLWSDRDPGQERGDQDHLQPTLGRQQRTKAIEDISMKKVVSQQQKPRKCGCRRDRGLI